MLWVNSGGLTNRIAWTWFAKLAKHRLQRGVFPWCNPADAVDRAGYRRPDERVAARLPQASPEIYCHCDHIAKPAPPAAVSATTTQGGAVQMVKRTNPTRAKLNWCGLRIALVQTG